MGADRKTGGIGEGGLPEPPRLPERAAIYIATDGTVHFGALFEGLVPVARALGAPVGAAALPASDEQVAGSE